MQAAVASEASIEPARMRTMLRELQAEALTPALPAVAAAGLLLVASAVRWPEPLQAGLLGVALLLLPLGVWGLRPVSRMASAWLLVIGCIGVDLLVVSWAGVTAAVHLLAVPVGLATLTLGLPGGASTAAVCSLVILFAPEALVPDGPAVRAVAVVGVWSAVGLVWLTTRPLLTVAEWSWSSYQQSRRLLERARDYQVQLKQTLADLADANLQLTRLNRLADALRRAAEEARLAKERFVANVSHELRTPLNMIVGFSEMMLQAPETYGSDLPPTLLADLAVILRNSQHLSGLIDDVLDLSQIETGRMALTKESVSLPEIVFSAAAAVRPLFDSKGLYLTIEVAEDLPPVVCDRTRIREVILNLLSNAGRFTERGGVRVRAWRQRGDVVFSVGDTGPGIAAEEMGRIFQPFQQLDGSIRRRHGGSGLGLSISRSFVELHGGKMWLESERGVGTTFFFRLPVEPPPPAEDSISRWFGPYWHYEERTRRPLAEPPAVRPRFVVLEHGDSLQRLLARYLDRAETVPVCSVQDAIGELSRVPAEALLVNGESVAAVLQRLDGMAGLPYGTPVIVCSLPGPSAAAGDLGVTDYLVKPVSREALLAALDRLPAHPRSVLIVDDELEARQLFWRMLATAGRGYQVLVAADGQQALSLLGQERPDAVLLDLVMPDMDGFRFLEARSRDPELQRIPVLVISARDPAGQPIVSKALAVTRGGGLSIPQLLACIEGLSRILAAGGQPPDRAPAGTPPG